jgi:putative transposase
MNYSVIPLPHFDTRNMVRRGLVRIRRKTVHALATWSPCAFCDRLIGTSRRFSGCHVIQMSEAFSSETCGVYGNVQRELGGKKYWRVLLAPQHAHIMRSSAFI